MSSCDQKQTILTDRANMLVAKLTTESKALASDIQEKSKEIDPNINTDGPDVWIGMDIDISWKRVDFSLDLPEVTMKDQKWSLDVPQVTMKDQSIIFHTPSIRMKTVKTGQYPEITCRMETRDIGLGVKIDVPVCVTTMKDMFMDVPEPFMQEQKIVMGIPEFKMDRTEMILGIPEFTMKTQKFSLDLPEFTAKNIKVEANKAKDKGDALSAEARTRSEKLKETFKENAKLELSSDVATLFDCYQSELMQKKNEAMQQFENGVNLRQSTITAMAANKMSDDQPNVVSVKQSLADLLSKREAFALAIQEKFVDLGKQQENFFKKFIGGA